MSASAPWSRLSAGRLSAGSTDDWRRTSTSMPPTTSRQRRSGPGSAGAPKSRRSCPAAGPRRRSAERRLRFSVIADHATYRDHWPLLQSTANAWDRLRAGDAALVSEQLARRLKLEIGDRDPDARAGRKLDRSKWSASTPTTATLRARSPSISLRWSAASPTRPQTRLGLRVAPAAVPGLIAAIHHEFGLDDRNLRTRGR